MCYYDFVVVFKGGIKMKIYRGIITETIMGFYKTMLKRIAYPVFADDGGNNPEDNGDEGEKGSSTSTINYEDLIAKAREEEKRKQFKKIEKLEEKVDTLTKQHNEDLIKIAEAEKKIKETEEKLTKAGKGDNEEVKVLKAEVETLKKDKETLEAEVKKFKDEKPVDKDELEKEIRAELEKEYEVKLYKTEQLAEKKDEILVSELVFGDTKEEIDESIKKAIERSNEIKKNLGLDGTSTQKKKKGTPKGTDNPSIFGAQTPTVDVDKVRSMSNEEYAELRKQLGIGRNR